MSHRHPCLDAFHRGAADRQLRPLPSGRYKLQEFIFNRERELEELKRLTRYLQGYVPSTALLQCTSEDKADWMRSLPEEIAYRVGYEVLPATRALVADGATLRDIERSEESLRWWALQLVDQLNIALEQLHHPIRIEYECMKAGQSILAPPITGSITLAKSALSFAP